MDDRATQHRLKRRARDRATILLILGVVLLMPPFAAIFNLEVKIGGVPVALVYLFAVWALLIIGTVWLAPQLGDSEDGSDTTR